MSSSTQVQASVLHGAKDLRIETRTVPSPEATEVQVAVHSTGLCGSDLHYFNHGRNGDIILKEPLTLGHESSGIVTAVGSSVSNVKVGDRVALEVGVPCDACGRCEEGRYNICKSMRFRSSAKSFPHFQGTLQGRINHPSKWVHKLPDKMSMELGALLEPLSVAIHAYRRSGLKEGQTVLVLGAGAVGLLAAAVARVKGAKTVLIADIDQGRVDFAVNNGFANKGFTVPMKRGKDTEETLAIARETADSLIATEVEQGALGEVDVVFECTGVPACVQAGIYATKPGGRVMLIGMGIPIQTLALSSAALREVDLVGVFRYANTYPEGIEVVTSKNAPDFSKLVTHKFKGLNSVPEAFAMAGKTKEENGNLVLKVVIETSEESKSVL